MASRTPRTDSSDNARSWVRKEAALKSLGIGLRTDPADCATPPSGIPIDVLGDGAARVTVTVHDLVLPWPEAAAAVAVAGQARRVDTLALRSPAQLPIPVGRGRAGRAAPQSHSSSISSAMGPRCCDACSRKASLVTEPWALPATQSRSMAKKPGPA